MVKNPPANAGGPRDAGSIPGSGRSPGEGHGNPFQYSCLENPMGRGIWQATVYRVGKESETTEQLSTAHTHTHTLKYTANHNRKEVEDVGVNICMFLKP